MDEHRAANEEQLPANDLAPSSPEIDARFIQRLLADEIQEDMTRLLERLSARVDDLPEYSSLSPGRASADFRNSVLRHLEVVRDLAREEIGVAEARTYAFNAARRRAVVGIPLSAVLRSYQITSSEFWQWLVDTPLYRSWGREALRHSWELWLGYVNLATSATADAYTDLARDSNEVLNVRRTFIGLLLNESLDAQDIQGWLQTIGAPSAEEFQVIAITSVAQQNDSDKRSTPHVAERIAKLFRLELGLDAVDHINVTDSAIVVIGRTPDAEGMTRIVTREVAATGSNAVFSGTVRHAEHIAELFRHARRVADNTPPGDVIFLRSMSMLDHAITVIGNAGQHLLPESLQHLIAGMKESDRQTWFQTLTAWYSSNLDAHAVANALFIHTNTVYYRLRRIRETSGWDPFHVDELVDLIFALRISGD